MTENPLLKALPPETDYLSYLTILEYNLTLEQLPTLHGILQDSTLSSNIGWDLVHLLLPLLPDSRLCLQDVARLGNPREVVLKVTELLEHLGAPHEDLEEDEDDEDGEPLDSVLTVSPKINKATEQAEDSALPKGTQKVEAPSAPKPESSEPPSNVLKFATLVSMLQTLHPRIKTKYPSRFLSTSLQAILPAYASVVHEPEATEAVIAFVKALSGTSRPKLPPRMSSTSVLTQKDREPKSAPDPEGNDGSVGLDEVELQKRLLQSFLTYVVEAYAVSLPILEDVPGVAWSSRLQEKLHPEKSIPGRRAYSDMYALPDLHSRDTIIGQLVALARDLKLTSEELLAAIVEPDKNPLSATEDLPSSAADVPLSLPGSLYLLSATAAASTLFDAPTALPSMAIFPQFSSFLPSFIGVSAPSSAGSEPACLIDAVLFLGTYVLSTSSVGTPETDETFNGTLQRLSLLSANTPVPSLRYHAHILTAEILHSHPKEELRLAYIKDTLEHCPYENLKASAVGWLKTELLAADKATPSSKYNKGEGKEPSLFATPVAISTLSQDLFATPTVPEDLFPEDTLAMFSNHQPFWMAVLNLVYLILSSPSLSRNLNIEDFITDATNFTDTMSRVTRSVRDRAEEIERSEDVEQDIVLLEGTVEMVMGKLDERGKSGT